ncbi:uncharacterized protein [Cicer arietinum]|uniref:Uncharacterized protein LOC101502570 n=1 Tax=Cicer arietinum TaxID=3827 RepID=A0A1S2YCY7_CICAR|nr:uncharacterized protein LOC101502570 [Cicer arietinum]XP_004502992.1 uncharacterized protein LOC101502570 [Cicer arietinum]
MLPLKLVRSLVLGESINHNSHFLKQNHNHHDDEQEQQTKETRRRRRRRKSKRPALLFIPTKEIITNTYKLATIARDLGMDLYPTPSLSHIIFSNPSSTPSTSSSSPSPSTPSTSTFSVSSASCSLLNDAVPIPFPSFSNAPLTHLRYFVTLFPRAFKLVLFNSDGDFDASGSCGGDLSNWDCCSFSLYSRVSGNRVETMEGFCRILAGKGWTFFKTKKNSSTDQCGGGGGSGGGGAVYLFRKVDVNRVRVGRVGTPDRACRVRELRLPHLDFENAPLRILQYILLMTDDIFCLA